MRAIPGENPLYLPQAKLYEGACVLGPGIEIYASDENSEIGIQLQPRRLGDTDNARETSIGAMKRIFHELIDNPARALRFPRGIMMMAGTGLVLDREFTLQPRCLVTIQVGKLVL